MTADELRKLADECVSGDQSDLLWDEDRVEDLGEKIAKALALPDIRQERIRNALRGSWDAFVALLPKGWGWARNGVRITVWDANGESHDLDADNPQPNHGVAAILRALANQKEMTDEQ